MAKPVDPPSAGKIPDGVFRAMAETAPEGIAIFDAQGIFLFANAVAANLFGRSVEDLVGTSLGFPLPAGVGSEIEIAHPQRPPARVDVLAVECDWDGRRVVAAAFRDATSRKKAEEESRRREHILAEAQRVAHVGSWIYDAATREAVWSAEMLRIFGLPPDGPTPSADRRLALIHPDDRHLSNTIVEAALSEGRPYEVELRIVRPDGTVRAIMSRGEPQRDPNGRILRLLGTVLDVTERKRIEDRLREREREYDALFNQGRDAIIVADAETGIIFKANATTSRLLKRPLEDIIGLHQSEVHPPELREFSSRRFAQRISDPSPVLPVVEGELYASDGERIPVEIRSSVVVLPGGRRAMQGVFRDIRERRAAEAKHRESVERLRKALGGTISVITAVVERRDPYTGGHQRRVADLARSLGGVLGLDADRIEGLRMAATIHDIGKISVPGEILSKSTKLSDLEMQLVRSHAHVGYEIVKDVAFPWPVGRMICEHHERLDGSGYPFGLRGEDILLEARILAVADVVEAMASHRPYRPAHGLDTALREIEAGRGTLYDSEVVDACLKLFREKGYRLVD